MKIEWIRDPSGFLLGTFEGGRVEVGPLDVPKVGNEYEYHIWWSEGSGAGGDALTEEDAILACERLIAEHLKRRRQSEPTG